MASRARILLLLLLAGTVGALANYPASDARDVAGLAALGSKSLRARQLLADPVVPQQPSADDMGPDKQFTRLEKFARTETSDNTNSGSTAAATTGTDAGGEAVDSTDTTNTAGDSGAGTETPGVSTAGNAGHRKLLGVQV